MEMMMIVEVFLKVCEGTERRRRDTERKDVCTLIYEELRGCEQFKRKDKASFM